MQSKSHALIKIIHDAATDIAVLADSDTAGPAEYVHDLAIACQEIAARIREIAGEESKPAEYAARIYGDATRIASLYEQKGRAKKTEAA